MHGFTIMKKLCLILLSILLSFPMRGEPLEQETEPSDSIRISLLTCSAGKEIYSLFGHTAIRIEDAARGVDEVYNYGIFNFDAPHFILRFALGKTDYQLGKHNYPYFAAEYIYLERGVRQQILNLSPPEKERLVELLTENYRPENRVYRYNFFFDNCATRPRDLIEKSIKGTLQYADDMTDYHTGITFRDLLHKYSQGHPWSRFGMDLCMGSQADKQINRRTMMFVPFYVESYFNKAQIVDTLGESRPLVAEESVLISTPAQKDVSDGFTPLHAALLLLLLTILATLYGNHLHKSFWGVDLVLFAAAGINGCILAFLVLFSAHPAVSPNYLLFLFHPFHLLCLPWILHRVKNGKQSRYLLANAVVLTLFILLWAVIPQRFPIAVLPLTICLLLRSVNNILRTRLKA